MHEVGTEWLVDASGCDARRLSDMALLKKIVENVITTLDLRVVGDGAWHSFPPPAHDPSAPTGVTCLYLLTESHVACHTYPEHGVATFNVYCCRPRPEYPWREELARALGAAQITVRRVIRGDDRT
ncbi:MAG TPA: S-adenosylmethionine decarboxylase [Polyangiaceae bacterium]